MRLKFPKWLGGLLAAAITLAPFSASATFLVPQGGTGQQTLTANAILQGNGTAAVTGITGTVYGQMLVWNGTSWAKFATSTLGISSLSSLTATYPLIFSGTTLSSGLGTTSSNTWGGTQTFTNSPVLGSLTGLIKAASGVLSAAASGVDYELPLTFSTGLTRTTNTITVNTSQNIATLSNLTTNGFVKTSGGVGTLSVDTVSYTPTTRSLTVNGTSNQISVSGSSQDLSADRTWTASLPSFVLFPGSASSTRMSVFDKLYVGGTATTTIDSAGNVVVAGNTSVQNLTINGTCTGCSSGSISALGAQYSTAQTNSTQTFATSSPDTNLQMTITSTGGTHTFTPAWAGTLAESRGGTGANLNTSFGWLFTTGGTTSASSSPTVNQIAATSTTATSTIAAGIYITSTGHGISFADGTYQSTAAISGGTVGSGTLGQFPYYSGSGTTLAPTSTISVSNSSFIGIGTTSPQSLLAVQYSDMLQVSSTSVWTKTGTTFTAAVPANTVQVAIQVWGAGGGGASGTTNTGGAGAGGYLATTSVTSPSGNMTIIIGQGGRGAASGSSPGSGGTGFATGGNGANASNLAGGGGGGSTEVIVNTTTLIAAGGGGGGASQGPAAAATGTSGGAGGGGGSGPGGGGAANTNGSNGSVSTGGAGGTGGTSITGTSGAGSYGDFNSPISGGGGGSSAGAGGNGNSATTQSATAGSGSGGAAHGVAGSGADSGGGGNGTAKGGTGAGEAGGTPGGGGGGANLNTSAGGNGGDGKVILTFYSMATIVPTNLTSTFNVTSPHSVASVLINQFVLFTEYVVEKIDQYGHLVTGGPAPTCGAGCSTIQGDDRNMRILTGSSVTTIVANFANTYTQTPVCIANEESIGTVSTDASSTPTTVTVTTASALTTKFIVVHCESSSNFTF